MHFKKISIFLFLVTLFLATHAQNSQLDSLLAKLETATEDTNKVRIYQQVFKKYFRPNPNKAIEYGKMGLKLATKLNDNIGISKLSNNIGIINYLHSNHSEALEYYAVSLETAIKMKDSLSISQSYNNFGVVYFAISAYEEAIEYYTLSYKIKESLGDSIGMAKIKNNIASVFYEQGKYPEALANYVVSLEIKKRQGDKEGQAQTLMNIAAIYEKQKNFDTSLEKYAQALEIYRTTENQVKIADVYSRIGSFYTYTNKYDRAIEYFEKSLTIAEKTGNKKQMSITLGNLGSAYFEKKQMKKSIEQYEKALDIAKSTKSFKKIIGISIELAKVYNKIKQPAKAIKYLKEAEKSSPRILTLDNKKHLYQTYLIAYLRLGKVDSADVYLSRYQMAHDQLFSKKNRNLLSNMQVKYETGKKQKEIELLTKNAKIEEQEKQVQRTQMFMLIGGLGVLLIVIFIVLYFLHSKRKANDALSKKNRQLFQHREEIATQNEELQKSKDKIELHLSKISAQHTLVLKQKKHITDSIVYAERIQQAALPEKEVMNQLFTNNFIYYRPRDIVSGDFYWVKEVTREQKKYKVIAVADCTGHGVPGAFVSMLGISFLNEIIRRPELASAGDLLDELRHQVKTALKQTHGVKSSKDGMDIALCVIEETTNILQFAGAYNPLYIIRHTDKISESDFSEHQRITFHNTASFPEKTLIELKADRQPIGIYKKESPFKNTHIQLKKDDLLYLFSDGYIDQFNGTTGEKFKTVRFKQLLLQASERPMNIQQKIIDETFEGWKKEIEQVDDIIIIGLKI